MMSSMATGLAVGLATASTMNSSKHGGTITLTGGELDYFFWGMIVFPLIIAIYHGKQEKDMILGVLAFFITLLLMGVVGKIIQFTIFYFTGETNGTM